jgi:hypothetical protein
MAAGVVICAALLALLLAWHRVPRPRAAAAWAAVALWTELSAGRAIFTLGLAAALGCVLVADGRRPWARIRLPAGAALAVTTGLLSPVADLFLAVPAVAFMLTGPLLAGMAETGSPRRRARLAAGLVAAAVWQIAQPVADLARGNGPPYVPQTAALVRELQALGADTARVEAVPQYGHWESQQLALAVPLTRG